PYNLSMQLAGARFAHWPIFATDDAQISSPRFADHNRDRPAEVTGNSHDQGIAVFSPLRPAVLVAILFGIERQCAEECARHHAALWRGRRSGGSPGDAGRGGFHLSVFRAFGPRRRTG